MFRRRQLPVAPIHEGISNIHHQGILDDGDIDKLASHTHLQTTRAPFLQEKYRQSGPVAMGRHAGLVRPFGDVGARHGWVMQQPQLLAVVRLVRAVESRLSEAETEGYSAEEFSRGSLADVEEGEGEITETRKVGLGEEDVGLRRVGRVAYLIRLFHILYSTDAAVAVGDGRVLAGFNLLRDLLEARPGVASVDRGAWEGDMSEAIHQEAPHGTRIYRVGALLAS